MRIDALRAVFTYCVVILTLAGGFYAIVLAPFVLDDLSKGALIGFMGMALNFAFGAEVAKQTSVATTKALMTPAAATPAVTAETTDVP